MEAVLFDAHRKSRRQGDGPGVAEELDRREIDCGIKTKPLEEEFAVGPADLVSEDLADRLIRPGKRAAGLAPGAGRQLDPRSGGLPNRSACGVRRRRHGRIAPGAQFVVGRVGAERASQQAVFAAA